MYYHVTHTDKIPAIRKKGLLPMQTSNWVEKGSGDQYGGGDVFVFEQMKDAIKWAAQMDWSFNTKMGSGKISIIEVNDEEGWTVDDADPLGQMMSDGRWLKRSKRVAPDSLGKDISVGMDLIKKIQAS